MSNHSIVEAKDQLSSLIDRAVRGEEVVITRHGRPIVTIKPVARKARPMTEADLDWLRRHRVGTPSIEDAGAYVSRMRDEDWR
jgi:prevent-host-death family protein